MRIWQISMFVVSGVIVGGCSAEPLNFYSSPCTADTAACTRPDPIDLGPRPDITTDMAIVMFAPPLEVEGSVSCSFGDCIHDGWSGDVSASCSFGDCAHDGWRGNLPDGTSYSVSCKFGDCTGDGWTMTTDAGRFDTSCKFGSCFEDGWRTTTPDGESIDVSCSFGDCVHDGWRVSGPDGSLSCSCSFSNCATDGVSCR